MRPSNFIWGVRSVCFQDSDKQDAIIRCHDHEYPVMYAPLETYSGLFMTFAETETDPVSMLHFAEKYGMFFKEGEPESVEFWRNEINNMRVMVDAWQSDKESCNLLHPIEASMDEVRLEFLRDTHELVLAPRTLKAALWLQLALAISEDKKFRHCTWCNTPFHAKGKQVKAERVFCSNSCKSLDYRHRKELEARNDLKVSEILKKKHAAKKTK